MNLREFLRQPTYSPIAFLAIVCIILGFAIYNLLASFILDVVFPVLHATVGINPGQGLIILDESGHVAWLGAIWTNLIVLGGTWFTATRLFPRLWDRYLDATQECPYCLSDVNVQATRCSHCGSEMPAEASHD